MKGAVVEELVGDTVRLRAWLQENGVVMFEVSSFSIGDGWTEDVVGSFRSDDCANFTSNKDCMVHTCGLDGFKSWCEAVARIPALVKRARA